MQRAKQSWWKLVAIGLVAVAEAVGQGPLPPRRRIVVSIPDRKLALIDGNGLVKVYDVAVGAPATPSPTGTFTIVNRIPEPTWYIPGKVVPPGKANPLGTRWMGLSLKGFGIHGTNRPRSIGHARSHGCIRLRNRDAEDLFSRVRVGDVVEMQGERDAELVRILDPAEQTVVETAAAMHSVGAGE